MLQTNDMTVDKLLGGRVLLKQPLQGYRSAIDSVLLAASLAAKPGERLLELGLGAGAVSLCLLARLPGVHVTGIERDPAFIELARENRKLNDVEQKLEIIAGSLEVAPAGLFDHVFANPPFHY